MFSFMALLRRKNQSPSYEPEAAGLVAGKTVGAAQGSLEAKLS